MPKHTVEIPKGTVIKINDEIKILTKGIRLAQKGNDLVVVDFDEITMKNDERMGNIMTESLPDITSNIPMPKVKPIKTIGLEVKYLKLALEAASTENIGNNTKHAANNLLTKAFEKVLDQLIEDDKKDSENI